MEFALDICSTISFYVVREDAMIKNNRYYK